MLASLLTSLSPHDKNDPAETIKKVGGEEEHLTDEYPAHEMTISKPFYMGIYELTQQAQWKAVMGTEPWMTKTAWDTRLLR